MGNRVKQVSLAEATPDIQKIYQQIFGDRDRLRACLKAGSENAGLTGSPSSRSSLRDLG
jgi:hypothetical protein